MKSRKCIFSAIFVILFSITLSYAFRFYPTGIFLQHFDAAIKLKVETGLRSTLKTGLILDFCIQSFNLSDFQL